MHAPLSITLAATHTEQYQPADEGENKNSDFFLDVYIFLRSKCMEYI